MFKVVLVGSGYIAQNHIAALKTLPNAELVGIVNRHTEKAQEAAKASGCAAFATLKEALLATGANLVDICTPTFTHEAYAVEAANAKCHVLCEKPVTLTLESLDRMLSACEKNNVRFMVAQVARWWPEFVTIKEMIKSGALGDIHMIYEKRLAQHPTWATWHRDPEKSGGGLYDMNIHDIDFLYSIFGMPKSVHAIGWKSESGCWNHVCTHLNWASGAKAVCETSLEMTGNFPFSIECRATGDKGTVLYDMTAGFNINDGEASSQFVFCEAGKPEVRALTAEAADMFAGEISEFLEAIEQNRPAAVTPEQSRDVLKIILATKESLETGETVKL